MYICTSILLNKSTNHRAIKRKHSYKLTTPTYNKFSQIELNTLLDVYKINNQTYNCPSKNQPILPIQQSKFNLIKISESTTTTKTNNSNNNKIKVEN